VLGEQIAELERTVQELRDQLGEWQCSDDAMNTLLLLLLLLLLLRRSWIILRMFLPTIKASSMVARTGVLRFSMEDIRRRGLMV
jgi:hypothetical protein